MMTLGGSSAPFARILIVDDERDNRELLSVILGFEGFRTTSAASGEEALVSATDDPPDLILLDVMMPGMDGFEVATRLGSFASTACVPIIIVSALSDRAARERSRQVGAVDFLVKPLDRDVLMAQVRAALGRTKPHAPAA